ncbi:MAG: hypothetical protein IPJ65_33265 [Archangiaceae bacterium]|nr:hypothetical protein [Archangiaceae bacterium]
MSGAEVTDFELVEGPVGARLTASSATSASIDWHPTSQQTGPQLFDVAARRGTTEVRQRFSVEVQCPQLTPQSSCGCSQAEGVLAALGLALLLRRRRRYSHSMVAGGFDEMS